MRSKVGSSNNGHISAIRAHVKQTFEEISEDFDLTRYKPWPETIEYLKSLPKHTTVLDLGIGNGRNAIYAVRNGLNVIGIDFSRSMVVLSRSKYLELALTEALASADFFQSDVTELPFRDGSFDAAFCVASLHHIPSEDLRGKATDELYRVLKRHGSALISVWDLDQSRFRHELMRQLYGVCLAGPPGSSQSARYTDELRVEAKQHPHPYEFGDVWVPWQAKNGKLSYRFYHLFYHNELVRLVEKSGFIAQKYFRNADNHNVIVYKS